MIDNSNDASQYPLSGLKVLDFSRVLSGPFASRMLSDLGADVVKVEPPDGDITRLWGKVIGGVAGYYGQINAGKRNIGIDLRAKGAKPLVLELVRTADIVIENYRPDVMARLGLSYADLKAANPRIIMLSISGFGAEGPESHRGAYAPIVHAETGLLARHSQRSKAPLHDLPNSMADTNAGLHGLVALLAAVIYRQQSGLGQHIDIAMMDSTLVTDDQSIYDLEDSADTQPLPVDVWQAPPGPILISTDFRYLWYLLVKEKYVDDPTHSDMPLDEKIQLRRQTVSQFLQTLPSWEAIESVMSHINVAWGRVRKGTEVIDQPTLKHRQSIAQIDDRAGGTRPIAQSPYRFSNAKSGIRGPAPHRGEHNKIVLSQWLGKSQSDVESLLASGVLHFDAETNMT